MHTASELRLRTVKELMALAKRKGVPGCSSMRKEELIKAILSAERKGGRNGKRTNGKAKKKSVPAASNASSKKPSTPSLNSSGTLEKSKQTPVSDKDLTTPEDTTQSDKDRIVLMVRDPYWLQAYWEISAQAVERARVALGQLWHAAKAVLRLIEIAADGTTGPDRRIADEIQIHGGVNKWYINVDNPPRRFQVEIGYSTPDGKFYCLARSNTVTTPALGVARWPDFTWVDIGKDVDRIFAFSDDESADSCAELQEVIEEHLQRPLSGPLANHASLRRERQERDLPVRVTTELIVHGITQPGAKVTLKGEPIPVQPDGTFTVRYNLPERRQVFPVVVTSEDGTEQKTVVLAVERNTKVMEPAPRNSQRRRSAAT